MSYSHIPSLLHFPMNLPADEAQAVELLQTLGPTAMLMPHQPHHHSFCIDMEWRVIHNSVDRGEIVRFRPLSNEFTTGRSIFSSCSGYICSCFCNGMRDSCTQGCGLRYKGVAFSNISASCRLYLSARDGVHPFSELGGQIFLHSMLSSVLHPLCTLSSLSSL